MGQSVKAEFELTAQLPITGTTPGRNARYIAEDNEETPPSCSPRTTVPKHQLPAAFVTAIVGCGVNRQNRAYIDQGIFRAERSYAGGSLFGLPQSDEKTLVV